MLSELTLRASQMAWQKRRSNSALIASSIRRRWRNSSFSIIQAGAPASAWRWIGKRQTPLPANRPQQRQCHRTDGNGPLKLGAIGYQYPPPMRCVVVVVVWPVGAGTAVDTVV